MPELPDVVVYIEALEKRIAGETLERIRIASPFLLRSFETPVEEAHGRRVAAIRRMGKRIAIELEGGVYVVIHLMIAGRFQWKEAGAPIPKRLGLAAFDFQNGTLLLTEASKKRRASLHVVEGPRGLEPFRRGGIEPLEATLESFREALEKENHTLKRSLTDPRIFSGVGNAYSDEILHAARLSPFKQTGRLEDGEIRRLHAATRGVLALWIRRLRAEAGDGFPANVTAFRAEMAVHGKHRKPCPECGTPIQRIVYAENESNYCPTCQTGGRLLADRALSRLLKRDWPKTVEELEERRGGSTDS